MPYTELNRQISSAHRKAVRAMELGNKNRYQKCLYEYKELIKLKLVSSS